MESDMRNTRAKFSREPNKLNATRYALSFLETQFSGLVLGLDAIRPMFRANVRVCLPVDAPSGTWGLQ